MNGGRNGRKKKAERNAILGGFVPLLTAILNAPLIDRLLLSVLQYINYSPIISCILTITPTFLYFFYRQCHNYRHAMLWTTRSNNLLAHPPVHCHHLRLMARLTTLQNTRSQICGSSITVSTITVLPRISQNPSFIFSFNDEMSDRLKWLENCRA